MFTLLVSLASACVPTWIGDHHRSVDDARALRPSGDLEAWAEATAHQVEASYHEEGFDAAQVYWRVRQDCVAFQVDEGRIHEVRVVGIRNIPRFFMADDVDLLPGRIHRRHEVDASVAALGERREAEATSRLIRGDTRGFNRLGQLVWRRVLEVKLHEPAPSGLFLSLGTVRPFGLIASGDVILHRPGGTYRVALGLGIPVDRWLFLGQPVGWAYGRLDLGWEQAGRRGVVLDTGAENGVHRRPDLDVPFANVGRTHLELGYRVGMLGPFATRFGAAVDLARVNVAFGDGTSALDTSTLARGWLTAHLAAESKRGAYRLDYHTGVDLNGRLGLSNRLRPVLDVDLVATAAVPVYASWLLLRGRGVLREGDVRFYDQLAIAGQYQRVFFRDRYYTRRAIQTEVAYRQTLTRHIAVGGWHQASLFDAASTEQGVVVNGFGPSAHLTLGLAAIDLYYGWGLSTDGEGSGRNFALAVGVVY